jgi:hypothetical protein
MNHQQLLELSLTAYDFPFKWVAINYEGSDPTIGIVSIKQLDGSILSFSIEMSFKFGLDARRFSDKLYKKIGAVSQSIPSPT